MASKVDYAAAVCASSGNHAAAKIISITSIVKITPEHRPMIIFDYASRRHNMLFCADYLCRDIIKIEIYSYEIDERVIEP